MKAETATIVAAFLGNNPLPADRLPDLIRTTYAALVAASSPVADVPVAAPAVPIRKSVSAEAITCLECGKSLSMLKRHLRTDHDLDPDAYRAKWALAKDYPMVAPNYAEHRSALAKKIGLGTSRKQKAPVPAPVAAAAPRRGRPKKVVK